MFLYLNGQFVEKDKARISPFDHGFIYGMGVFETFRTYGGIPFLLNEHLDRLNAGLIEIGIHLRLERDRVLQIIQELSELNQLRDSYIRLNVSAGLGEIGLQTKPYIEPTVILFQKELPPMEPLREKEAVILNMRRNTPETKERLKSHHFLNNIAAKRELGPALNKEGIFLTEQGFLAEGVTSNLFWTKGGRLYTPAVDTGILNGITRQFILRMAQKLGIPAEEGLFRELELVEADEIFFTNSIQEVVPVHTYKDKRFPGKLGTITNHLYNNYQNAIFQLKKE